MAKNPIWELRHFLDLSQEQLAELLDATQPQISCWESGSRAMLATTVLHIWSKFRKPLRGLGFEIEDLLRVGRG